MSGKAVFFDRDGVLNHAIIKNGKPYPPDSLAELVIVEEALTQMHELKKAGFLLLGATNQPDVARGTTKIETVDAINAAILSRLPLDKMYVCPHDNKDLCLCRKPKAGMLLEAAAEYDLDLSSCYLIGDRSKDIEAGRNGNCRTVWLENTYDETRPTDIASYVAQDLKQACMWILKQETMMTTTSSLNVKLFADGANIDDMLSLYKKPFIKGFTTNPTLMRKAGISDYQTFALDILEYIKDYPISFEVFSDDLIEMKRQAKLIASWGDNVYVKIPITNTKKESTASLVKELAQEGIKINVTALMTREQVKDVVNAIQDKVPAYISVFAGRIADTGVDPMPIMKDALALMAPYKNLELIWASPRELLNIFQADALGCHVITATSDILNKLALVGKDLTEYSLDTVKMFYNDAQSAGYKL
jgi:transaldolase